MPISEPGVAEAFNDVLQNLPQDSFQPYTTTGRLHPHTSQLAALGALPRSGSERYRVFVALLVADATDEEIQKFLTMNASTERPRRVELVRAGLVEDSGTTRRNSNGRQCIVWRATMPGRTEAAAKYLGVS